MLLLITTTSLTWGIPNSVEPEVFFKGQSVYVVAPAGLNMRVAPNMDAYQITTIPYGSSIQILAPVNENLEKEEIEYALGSWIKVGFENKVGYVFDGFLSNLPIPSGITTYENDNSMMRLLNEWINEYQELCYTPDTIVTEHQTTINYEFVNGATFAKIKQNDQIKTKLILTDVRIMDVFHLIKGFYLSSDEKQALDENTLFIKDKNGLVRLIKIYDNNYCEIKRLKNGNIQLIMQST